MGLAILRYSGSNENISLNIGGYFFLGAGLGCYKTALMSFLRTRSQIQDHEKLDRRLVEPQLIDYCTRQGARTAAANCSLEGQFDEIMENYQGDKFLTFIPPI